MIELLDRFINKVKELIEVFEILANLIVRINAALNILQQNLNSGGFITPQQAQQLADSLTINADLAELLAQQTSPPTPPVPTPGPSPLSGIKSPIKK